MSNPEDIKHSVEFVTPSPVLGKRASGDGDLRRLGLVDYQAAWDLQRKLFDQRLKGEIPDTLLLCEHPHTYTIGKNGTDHVSKHLMLNQTQLLEFGINVFEIDRGGDITYHGPGQLVGYPIIDLNRHYRDVHRYLRDLEEVVIRSIAEWGIEGKRIDGMTGVWVDTANGSQKLCALGVKVTRWITMHGFALNVNTNLDYFNHIIPCGISDKTVTSMAATIGQAINIQDVADAIVMAFDDVFFSSPSPPS